MLVASAISQGYGSAIVLDGVDVGLDAGVYGLLGPNGAGKTTLLTTLATVAPPRSGCLVIDGTPITGPASARRARRTIGYLSQPFVFSPAFTIHDFLHYVAWSKGVPRAKAVVAVREVVEQVGLGDKMGAKLGSLSGGMLQRVGIAQALVNRPLLLLLDEPTVGLDPEQRIEFRRLLRGLEATTVLLSTHLVEDVAASCSDVLVMTDGRIRFAGTVGELRAKVGEAADDTSTSQLDRAYLQIVRGEAWGG